MFNFIYILVIHCTFDLYFRPELNILAFQPWTNLKVRGKVNDAIEEVGTFNILKTGVILQVG